MSKQLELALRIRALVEGLQNVDALAREVEALGRAAGVPFADPTEPLDEGAQQAAGSLENLRQKVLGLAAAIGAGALAKDFLDTANTFERFNIQLETIEGSSEAAQRSLDWITDFTAQTPYSLEEVTAAFVKLKAYGIEPTTGTLKTLGDTAAAMGKPLDQAVEALADAVTGEYERLKEFGIKAETVGDTVKFRYIQNGQEMVKEADRTSGEMIRATLEAIWNERYAGGMEKFSQSWAGMASNLGDLWTQFEREVMDAGVFDALKGELADLLAEINRLNANGTLKAWAQEVGQSITALIDGIAEVTRWLVDNRDILIELIKWYGVYKVATSGLLGTLTNLATTVRNVSGAMRAMAFGEVIAGAAGGAAQVKKLEAALTGLKAIGVFIAAELGYALGAKLRDELKGTFTVLQTESEQILAESNRVYAANMAHIAEVAEARARELKDFANQQIATNVELERSSQAELEAYRTRLESARRYYDYVLEQQRALGNAEGVAAAEAKIREYDAALQALTQSLAGAKRPSEELSAAARTLVVDFDKATEKGKDLKGGIDALVESLKLDSVAEGIVTVRAFGDALGEIERRGKTTEAELRTGLSARLAKLSGEELANFQTAARAAFAGSTEDAGKLALLLDSSLDAALVKLGVDVEKFRSGMASAEKDSIAAFSSIAANANASTEQIKAAFEGALKAVTTTTGIEALRAEITRLGQDGKLSGDQVAAALDLINAKAGTIARSLDPVEQAFKQLGIESERSLKQAADAALKAFETIRADGTRTPEELQRAWLAYAEKAVEANSGVVSETLKSQAAIMGVTDELMKLGDAGQAAGEKTAQGMQEATQAAAQAAQAAAQAAAAAQQQIQQYIADQNAAVSGWQTFWTNIRDGYYAMSDAVGAFYDRTLESIAGLNDAMTQFRLLDQAMDRVTQRYYEEEEAVASLTSQLADTDRITVGLIERAEGAADSFQYLGEEQLAPLRAAIDDAKGRMEALNNEVQGTLASLQDELDRLDNNQTAIEEREYARRRAELEQQLAEARALGERATIQQVDESLRLLDQIHQKKMADISAEAAEQARRDAETHARQMDALQREQAAARPASTSATTPSAPAPASAAARVVRIQFVSPAGTQATGEFEEAEAERLLRVLGEAGARTV